MNQNYELTYRGQTVYYQINNAPETPGVDSFLVLTKIPKCFGVLYDYVTKRKSSLNH